MSINQYLKTAQPVEKSLEIKPKIAENIGHFQLYLYPAEVVHNEKLYHQLIITEFDDCDKEKSHKMYYLPEGTKLILPKAKLEDAVKEIYSLPEHTRLEDSDEQSSMGCRKEIPGRAEQFKPYITINGVIAEGKGVFNSLAEHDVMNTEKNIKKFTAWLCASYIITDCTGKRIWEKDILSNFPKWQSEVSNEG